MVFFRIIEPPGAPTSNKMAPKSLDEAPRMEFGRWSYISRPSWTVLALILEGLGVDFAPLGVHLGSNLASKIAPRAAQEPSKIAQEPPKTTQEPSKNVQEPPKTAQECPRRPRSSPGAAQDSPRASQKPTKMPRNSTGPAQDLLRRRPGPVRTARDPTHYLRLDKKSKLHSAILQNFFPSHKAAEIKNERRRYSPQGGLQSARPPW